MNYIIPLALLCFLNSILSAQGVAINNDGSTANPTALLDIKSTNKGLLLPRMTSAQRKAIAVQESDVGLLVFDLDHYTLFMYDGINWMPVSFSSTNKLAPSIRTPRAGLTGSHHFGYAVAISGNYALVGSGALNVNAEGSVYAFEKTPSGWVEQARLTASDAVADQHFGGTISIYGEYAVIGVKRVGITTGEAYVFKRTGSIWTEQAKLIAPDGVVGDFFGYAVSMTSDMILITASGKDLPPFSNVGCVYVFKRSGNNWPYHSRFYSGNIAAQEKFGETIAVHENYAVIGSPSKTMSGTIGAGTAQVFFYNGSAWTHQANLVPPLNNTNGHFGAAVSIFNDYIAIGHPGLTVSGNANAGAVSIFSRTGAQWSFNESVTAGNIEANDQFGSSVTINNDFLLTGVPGKSINGFSRMGEVHVFKRDAGDQFFFRRIIRNIDEQHQLEFGSVITMDPASNNYLFGVPGKQGPMGQVSTGQVCFGFLEN